MFDSNEKSESGRLRIIHVPERSPAESVAETVRRGLEREPRSLPSWLIYDQQGSQFFEQICELPEYYPTRLEDAILQTHADELVDGFPNDRPPTLVELGSGSSTKTRRLISAALERYGPIHYVPIDVSPTILQEAADDLISRYPALRVTGLVATYHAGLAELQRIVSGPKLIVFLGSSLGNFEAPEAQSLINDVHAATNADDVFLLGLDMDKDPDILIKAYNDSQGVTERFNRNVLVRINGQLGGTFDLDAFAYDVEYDRERVRVVMFQRSLKDQEVAIASLGRTYRFAEGERIHTESSHKYRPEMIERMAARSGFRPESHYADPSDWFRLLRWRGSDAPR